MGSLSLVECNYRSIFLEEGLCFLSLSLGLSFVLVPSSFPSKLDTNLWKHLAKKILLHQKEIAFDLSGSSSESSRNGRNIFLGYVNQVWVTVTLCLFLGYFG